MKKIQTFSNFNNKVSSYLGSVIKKGGELASSVWSAVKVESQETKISIGILAKMVKGEEVSDNEKKFLKAQSKDIAKILPLVAIQGIPIPIPITPLLIMLGKKYGFDILPKDNRDILKDDTKSDNQ
jgi:hypothetical protein